MAAYDVTTAGEVLEHDTQAGLYNSLVQIDANHFIDFYQGNGVEGSAQVFTVNTSTWATTTASSRLKFDTSATYFSASQIDDNHFICF